MSAKSHETAVMMRQKITSSNQSLLKILIIMVMNNDL